MTYFKQLLSNSEWLNKLSITSLLISFSFLSGKHSSKFFFIIETLLLTKKRDNSPRCLPKKSNQE